jgi:hypothetical protein
MIKILNRHQETWWFLMLFFCTFLSISTLHGQHKTRANIGAGGGLSYGGFGARLTYLPVKQIGLFGSLGYNLDALGYNLGVQVHLPTEKRVSFYLTGMYGYNAVMKVEAPATTGKTTYYGISTGPGFEFGLNERSFLAAEVLWPFRPQVYRDALDDLKSINYDVKGAFPVAFCIGYHFKF